MGVSQILLTNVRRSPRLFALRKRASSLCTQKAHIFCCFLGDEAKRTAQKEGDRQTWDTPVHNVLIGALYCVVMEPLIEKTFDLTIPEELKDEVVEGVNVMYWIILEDKVMKQIKTQ